VPADGVAAPPAARDQREHRGSYAGFVEEAWMEARAIAVILAAGEGKRMKSILPKVLHRLAGRPLIEHVVQTAFKADMVRTIVVVGHRRDMVITALEAYPVEFVVQEPQGGTGHAMQQVAEHIGHYAGTLAVLLGDAPFIQAETLRSLVTTHDAQDNAATMLTAEIEDPSGYGRIVRGADGGFERIIEDADASDEERAIREINSGIGCFSYIPLCDALAKLEQDNQQGELYLTDTIEILRKDGLRVGAVKAEDAIETWGINDFQQLRAAERIYRERMTVAAEPPDAESDEVADGDGGEAVGDEALTGGTYQDQVYHAGDDDFDDTPVVSPVGPGATTGDPVSTEPVTSEPTSTEPTSTEPVSPEPDQATSDDEPYPSTSEV
jgi:NDP-sugar pyrophosphorylase family protein